MDDLTFSYLDHVRCAYCATCDREVIILTKPEDGCPHCGGAWTNMDGWYAFDGGDRVAHLERQLSEAKRERQRQKELAALKAWNKAMEVRRG